MTKTEFLRRLKPTNGTYERDGNAHTVKLPHGMRIIGGDCHDAYYHVAKPFDQTTTSEVYEELLGQLEAGTEPCNDPHCEYCLQSE